MANTGALIVWVIQLGTGQILNVAVAHLQFQTALIVTKMENV